MKSPRQRKELPFTVAIPIASLDQKGKALDRKLRRAWEERTVSFLTRCFGGATVVKATGEVRMADGTVSVELGQRVVVAGCTDVHVFRRYRQEIEDFAWELQQALDQESVCVLAFPWGESFMLE